MSGHHPWDELMRKHYTPEEREQMLEDARRELEEEERHDEVPAAAPGPTTPDPREHGSAKPAPRQRPSAGTGR